jgi:DNA-binding transcriptional regulator GbsR (MarR family)
LRFLARDRVPEKKVETQNMNKKTEKIKDNFIEAIGILGESLGLNRTVCQIYAFLYMSGQPVTHAEISKSLEMSKGSVSINLRKLEEWNAVEKVWKKGHARNFYRANEDIESIIFQKLKTGMEKRVGWLKTLIENIEKDIKKGKKRDSTLDNYEEKLEKFKKSFTKVEQLTENLNYLEKLLK